eukprot:10367-Pelagococcus_subviridis.AAC.2
MARESSGSTVQQTVDRKRIRVPSVATGIRDSIFSSAMSHWFPYARPPKESPPAARSHTTRRGPPRVRRGRSRLKPRVNPRGKTLRAVRGVIESRVVAWTPPRRG